MEAHWGRIAIQKEKIKDQRSALIPLANILTRLCVWAVPGFESVLEYRVFTRADVVWPSQQSML